MTSEQNYKQFIVGERWYINEKPRIQVFSDFTTYIPAYWEVTKRTDKFVTFRYYERQQIWEDKFEEERLRLFERQGASESINGKADTYEYCKFATRTQMRADNFKPESEWSIKKVKWGAGWEN